jgi:hypothetical protein
MMAVALLEAAKATALRQQGEFHGSEGHDGANAFALVHQVKGAIDF